AVDVKAGFDALKPLLDFLQVKAERPEAVDAVSLTVKVADDFALRGVFVCKDARAAEEARKQGETLRTAALAKLKEAPPGMYPKALLDRYTSVKLSTRGSLVETSVSLSPGLFTDMYKLRMAALAPDRYVLDDSNVLLVVRLDQLLASRAFGKMRRAHVAIRFMEEEGFRQTFGFGTANVERIVVGFNNKHPDRYVSVFHLNGAIKAETILKAKASDPEQKLIEEKVGSFTLHAPAKGEGFCLVDDRTLLKRGARELRAVRARPGPAALSAGLKEALKQAAPAATLTLAVDISALPADTPAPP